jgi:hypothetical protein
MSKLMVGLMTGLVALALTGCGQSPATATGSFKASTAKAASKAAPTAKAKAPSVSSRPSTSTKTPAKSTTPAPQAPADAAPETGSLKVAFKVTGNAPVTSLALKVFEQNDPSVSIDVPVTLTNGTATWATDEVGPGRYTFQVKALGTDKAVLGTGNGEAIVTAGKATEVALELRVNTAAPADDAGVAETPETPAQIGGTIGLNIEIY